MLSCARAQANLKTTRRTIIILIPYPYIITITGQHIGIHTKKKTKKPKNQIPTYSRCTQNINILYTIILPIIPLVRNELGRAYKRR
jgi:hypothetical protein